MTPRTELCATHRPLACADDDQRTPVVLLHAFPLDGRMWEPQRDALARRTRVLTPDLPGFGLSADHPAPASLDAWADLVERLLEDRLGPRAAVLCGLSMGGYVALRMAARHPRRLAALVLADTRAAPDDADGRRARDAAVDTVRTRGATALVDVLIPRLLAEGSPPEIAARVRDIALAQPDAAITGALRAMRDRPDSTPVLRQLEVPTLVVVGEHDRLTPPDEAAAMAAAVPRSELYVVPGAGHLTSLERSDAFTAAIERLLDRLAETAGFTPPETARRTGG